MLPKKNQNHTHVPASSGTDVFMASKPTIYRLYDTTGWGSTFTRRPVRIWPEAVAPTLSAEGLAFNVTASDGQQFVVEARSSLLSGNWVPIFTGTVTTAESFTYTDADADIHPSRYYRIILP